jgi:hypothetical protein
MERADGKDFGGLWVGLWIEGGYVDQIGICALSWGLRCGQRTFALPAL